MNHGPDYRGRATGFVQVKAIVAVMVQMWTSSQTMMAAELIGESMSEAVDAKERHQVPVSPVRRMCCAVGSGTSMSFDGAVAVNGDGGLSVGDVARMVVRATRPLAPAENPWWGTWLEQQIS